MSWKNDIRKLQEERLELLEKDRELRISLGWQLHHLLTIIQAADIALSLLGHLLRGRRRRRR